MIEFVTTSDLVTLYIPAINSTGFLVSASILFSAALVRIIVKLIG